MKQKNTGKKTGKKRVVVFCAHNDDNIIGAGGTIAKYHDDGKEIVTVIFSYGEGSHPWFKKKVTVAMRMAESEEAAKILGEKLTYLGLKDGALSKEIREKGVAEKIGKIISRHRPEKIFTHSEDDPHPDHRAVNKAVLEAVEMAGYRGPVYTFPVWNIVSLKERGHPKLYVDITETFKRKIAALRAHKSQKLAIYTLSWSVYMRAFLNGLQAESRYAEVFYKVR